VHREEVDAFDRVLDELSSRLVHDGVFVSEEYRSVFLQGLELLRMTSRYDVELAKALLKNMVDSSMVLLTLNRRALEPVTIHIRREE
jgi:hypothetical protein